MIRRDSTLRGLALLLALSGLMPRHADAFTCMAQEAGECITWPETVQPVPYVINVSQSLDLDASTALSMAVQGMAVWTDVCSACFSATFSGETLDEAADSDLVNTITWVADDWPFGQEAIGVTGVQWNPGVASIVEADMLLNNVDYTWATLAAADPTVEPDIVDALSIIVHEAGHFYGMDHSSDSDATMFPTYSTGSVTARTLADDDIEGISDLYPCATIPDSCDPTAPADDDDDDSPSGPGGGGLNGGGICSSNPNAPGCQPVERNLNFESESACGCTEIDRPFFPAGSTPGEKALWLAFQLSGLLLTAGFLARMRRKAPARSQSR